MLFIITRKISNFTINKDRINKKQENTYTPADMLQSYDDINDDNIKSQQLTT